MKTYRIAILASGHSRGSNLEAMHRYFVQNHLPVVIDTAIFTRADSPAMALASSLKIATQVFSAKDMASYEQQVMALCRHHDISLIALAGFLKKLSAEFLEQIGIPVLNIHPALLPKYGGTGMYGMAVHEAVFTAGEKHSGATVHYVDPRYDHGPIVAQETVDISICHSPSEIAATVLKAEHSLYGKSIYQLLSGIKP